MLGAVNPKPNPNPGPTQAELCWAPWVAPTVESDARCDDGQAELTLTPTLPLPPTLTLPAPVLPPSAPLSLPSTTGMRVPGVELGVAWEGPGPNPRQLTLTPNPND